MKASPPVLLCSLAANVALVGVLLWRVASPAATAIHAPSPAGPAAVPASGAAASVVPPDLGPETWKYLSAGSDAEFVARLRAEGFPPHLLFALVETRLRARHADELKRFRPPADYAYWRQGPQDDDLSPEDRAARRALDRRIGDERRQLLGPDADLITAAERANRTRSLGNISDEKADQVLEINKDYTEIAARLRDRARGVTLPEDREQLAFVEQERRADLAKVLTPDELREYDLRSSPSAITVRSRLRGFDATEEEFRALAGLQLAFDSTYGRTSLSPEQEQRRTAAAAELTTQIQALLPPERFAEYQVKTDQTYPAVAGLISQYNSPSDAATVVGAQRDLAQRFNALRQNRDLPAAVRDAQLDALSAEANRRMAAALGSDAFSVYKRNGGPINALLNRPAGNPGP